LNLFKDFLLKDWRAIECLTFEIFRISSFDYRPYSGDSDFTQSLWYPDVSYS